MIGTTVMRHDGWTPPRLTGRDVAGAWILTTLLFLGIAISM
ncbi:MAG: hypothetical protein O7B81_10080 [Gammaproteobacteria bacterium]|nr:hypothetical protein [Gammaproteobacteria bacterium]MCZ6772660.1 hypothetical protein [Pseudomonadota bacterium]